jgi:hypothetical protein
MSCCRHSRRRLQTKGCRTKYSAHSASEKTLNQVQPSQLEPGLRWQDALQLIWPMLLRHLKVSSVNLRHSGRSNSSGIKRHQAASRPSPLAGTQQLTSTKAGPYRQPDRARSVVIVERVETLRLIRRPRGFRLKLPAAAPEKIGIKQE